MIFSPTNPIMLDVPHIAQKSIGECLAACAAMACEYEGISLRYSRLVRALKIRDEAGTPFYNIQNLESMGVRVNYQTLSTLGHLYSLLRQNSPCIVSVQTDNLPYWNSVNTTHAIVLIGMDQEFVYLNDPAFPSGPIRTLIGDFDLAWLAHDEKFAVISK